MFGSKAIGIVLTCILTSIEASTTTLLGIPKQNTVCGQGHAGIKSPAPNSTLFVSLQDQQAGDVSFPIIYCSNAYFNTASLNVTATLSGGGSPLGVLLDTGTRFASGINPEDSMADVGYYGYNFTVLIHPDMGDWSPNRTLHIMEWQTGYGFAIGIVINSVDFFLEVEPWPTSTTSSTTTSTKASATKTSNTAILTTASSTARQNVTSTLTTRVHTGPSGTGSSATSSSSKSPVSTPMYTYGLPPTYPSYTGGLLTVPLGS